MLLNENSPWLPFSKEPARWVYPPIPNIINETGGMQRGLEVRNPGLFDGRRKGVAYDGKSLFLFLGPIYRKEETRPNIGIGGMRPFKQGHLLLYHFRDGILGPKEIPVWLGFGAAKSQEEVPAVGGYASPNGFLLADTPERLFITEKFRSDLWIIPKTEIEKYR
jgi:hypothetical protein